MARSAYVDGVDYVRLDWSSSRDADNAWSGWLIYVDDADDDWSSSRDSDIGWWGVVLDQIVVFLAEAVG